MPFEKKVVDSLGAYLDTVAALGEKDLKNRLPPDILWFRGHSNAMYTLAPSLFRTTAEAGRGKHGIMYTNLHYAEDIRAQHYIAKNFHLISTEPASRVEWLEIMQHHQTNTRALDWSESSVHSLLFALEPFFEKRATDDLRKQCVPCVWVLKPGMLNRKILDFLKTNKNLQQALLSDLSLSAADKFLIMEKLEEFGNWSQYSETRETRHLDYIFNLSSINDEILRDRSRIRELLRTGDVMNPYFYLLARIYSDGYLLPDHQLPPLCVVQPYHSERIKAQRGVFSIFPFYERKNVGEENTEDAVLRNYGINPDAMERNAMAEECLCQIVIQRPQKVALEMMKNGMNDSWLYPEMPVVSSEIENHRIY